MIAGPDQKRDGVLDRSLSILGAFGDDLELTLNEITERVDLPKSTVHRLTAIMSERRLLHPTRRGYRLGVRLFEMGNRVSDVQQLIGIAQPYLGDLAESTRGTVELAISDGDEALYLSTIARRGAPTHPARAGSRIPLHVTAPGKAMLAFSGPAFVRAYLAKPLERRTPYTIVQPAVVFRNLERIRQQQFSLETEELSLGLASVGAPVLLGNWLVAAISVSHRAARLNQQDITLVRRAARSLSAELSALPPDDHAREWGWLRPTHTCFGSPRPGRVAAAPVAVHH